MQAVFLQTDRLQLLSDNGDFIYYNDGIIAKDLAQNNFKKFKSDVIISSTGAPLPVALKSFYRAERSRRRFVAMGSWTG